MATSIKDKRNRFIVKIAVLTIEGKWDIAEELIREARPLGVRKPAWQHTIGDFIGNRKNWPDRQGWAIRQWIVAANYANGSTITPRMNGAKP